MKNKEQLRAAITAKRNALDFQWVETACAAVVRNFQALEAFQTSETVALYKAIAGEVDLDALFTLCWESGKRTCIPVFNAAAKIYEMAEISVDTEYTTGLYGIREPVSPALVSMQTIPLVAVPGVAFDRNGNRLGRGGGHYDRLLKGFTGFSAAVAFDFQVFPRIPHDAHDVPMDALVTPSEIVNVSNER